MPEHLVSYIDGLVTAWYSEVVRWRAPGGAFSNDCVLCATSEVPDLLGLREWPHSATHSLVVDLTLAEGQAQRLLAEVGHQSSVPEAHELFRAKLVSHAPDVNDVLFECLEPDFAIYLAQQAAIGAHELEVMLSRVELQVRKEDPKHRAEKHESDPNR